MYRMGLSSISGGAVLVLFLAAAPVAAQAPQVVKMFPENGATDVDPKIGEMWVEFDQDMSTGGYSFCGGGEPFPSIDGRPKWVGKRKVVAKVKLEPDHDYRLSLNCPAANSFRSADGTPLEPVPWSFSTAAKSAKESKKKLKEQKTENAACLKDLMKLLKERYSYYDLRGVDWPAVEKKHRAKIVGAKSTRAWVKEVAEMLSAAQDMHLSLSYKGNATPTFVRKIERNYDPEGIKKVLPKLKQQNKFVQTARTPDDIGYLLIGTLSPEAKKDLRQVQDVLEEFKDCKALVIDLRPNGGGSEPSAMPIAAWFVKGEKIYSKNAYRDPKAKSGWTEVFDRTIKGNDPPKRFDKPIAVLIGPGVMSSAESFALMLKQGEKVTLIGEKTYGSSGNPKPQKLDNGVEIMLPSWKDMLPDGTCFEGQGIKPDIEVKAKAADFKKGDPVIEKALEHLRKQLTGLPKP